MKPVAHAQLFGLGKLVTVYVKSFPFIGDIGLAFVDGEMTNEDMESMFVLYAAASMAKKFNEISRKEHFPGYQK